MDVKEEEEILPPTPDELKEKGNECVRKEEFPEAILHYSHAIKLSPNNPILYSNRSLAFLKMKQLYYANVDADKAIQLKPDWPKGYFRRAEVQSQAGQYDLALLSYGRALQLQPNDINILIAAKKAAAYSNQQTLCSNLTFSQFILDEIVKLLKFITDERRIPWVGAGIGIILGVIIVISDQLIPQKSTIKHPSIMVILVIGISLLSYTIAKSFRYYIKLQKKGMLEPPLDLLEDFQKTKDDPEEEEIEQPQNRARYTKAQARQRFKKGKT